MNELEVVNVVGGGDLGRELNLPKVYEDLESYTTQYEPETFAALVIYYEVPKATVMLYTSGKFSLAGAGSKETAIQISKQLVSDIEELLGHSLSSTSFEIRYLVCQGDLGGPVDLQEVALKLGIEDTEYEPEQFPGLFYRPKDRDWFATLFATGKVLLNGTDDIDDLQQGFVSLQKRLIETETESKV